MKIHHRFTKIYFEHQHIKIYLLTGLILLTLILIKISGVYDNIYLNQPVGMGISFSPSYAQALGLDSETTYQAVLEDLQVKLIRLNVYWNEIEPRQDQFDFSGVDYYVAEAAKHQARVVLAIGYKLPRWPECRLPGWVNLDDSSFRQKRQLRMIAEVIAHFEQNEAISAWQVENEPLLDFGVCPPVDEKFLLQEIGLVRRSSKKPIILTDSGELRDWIIPMKLSDYFGTTLYRAVYNDFLGRFDYPFKPWFYRVKAWVVKKVFALQHKKVFITELQAEPWTNQFIANVPVEKQIQDFPVEALQKNTEFAKKVGFEEIYFWGVEWWYWMKTQGHPQYWEYGKGLFN